MGLFYVLVLAFSVSIDALGVGVTYGMKNIEMPLQSLVITGIATGLFTGVAMISANVVGSIINPHIAVLIGSILLFALGLWSIFSEYLMRTINKHEKQIRKLAMTLGGVIVEVIIRPEAADIDKSNSISSLEAVLVGIALGVDNMVATFAASMLGILPDYTPLLMAGVQMLLIAVGIQVVACSVPNHVKKGLPYIPGIMLMVIGLARIV